MGAVAHVPREQRYHGVVKCALHGRAEDVLGRPEEDAGMAMTELGNGLHLAGHYEEALSVKGLGCLDAAIWRI